MKPLTERRTSARRSALASLAISSTLVLTACGGGGGSSAGGGEGVDAGATKDDYVAAFKDIDPIELTAQSISAKGSYYSRGLESYAAALDDWSGGKITVDLQYNAAVASPDQADAALVDGRLDIAAVFPSYAPKKYPVYNAWNTVGTGVEDPTAGMVAWNLYQNDVGLQLPEVEAEMDEHGLKMLLPFNISDSAAMGCTTDRSTAAKAKGGIARTAGVLEIPYVESIGLSPVSMPFTEVFEALERGTIDCTLTSLGQAQSSGYLGVAKNWVVGTDRPSVMHMIAVGKDRFESLPLVAQQLMWDRLDALYEDQLLAMFEALGESVPELVDAGGSISKFDASAVAQFEGVKDDAVKALEAGSEFSDPDALVALVDETLTAWDGRVADAGIDSVEYMDYPAWYADNEDAIDLASLMDTVRSDLLDTHRPS